jgi:hypothetical protein
MQKVRQSSVRFGRVAGAPQRLSVPGLERVFDAQAHALAGTIGQFWTRLSRSAETSVAISRPRRPEPRFSATLSRLWHSTSPP